MNRTRAICFAIAVLLPSLAYADDRLNGIGTMLMSGRAVEARKVLVEARDAYAASGNQASEATAWLLLGMCDSTLKDPETSRADLHQAAARFAAGGDEFGGWLTLWTLAELETAEGHFPDAIAAHTQALERLRAAADPKSRFSLDTLKVLAPVFGMPPESLGQIAAVPEIAKPILLQFASVMSHDGYGRVLVESGQFDKAEEQLQQAVSASAIFGGLFDSSIQVHIGDMRRGQWRFDEARASYLKALEGVKLFPAVGFRESWIEVDLLGRLADLDGLSGKLDDALAWNDQALKLVRASDNPRRVADILDARGTLLQNGGRSDDALRVYNEALQIAQTNGDAYREAGIHASLGALYMFQGSYGTSAKHLEKSIEQYQSLKQPYLEASVWTLLAEVDLLLNANDNAAEAIQNASVLAKKSGFSLATEMVKMLTASHKLFTGKATPDEMVEALNAWWDVPETKSLMFGPEAQQVLLDTLRLSSGGTTDVAPDLVRTAGPQFLRWMALMLKGVELFKRGDAEAARKYWNEALAANPSRDHQAGLYGLIGASYWREAKRNEAISYLKKAADTLDASASDVKVEELLSSYLGSNRRAYYDILIDMLVQQGQYADAFAQTERARARAFLQLVGNHHLDAKRGADPALVRETEMLRAQIARWELQKTAAKEDEARKIESDIEHARQRYQTLLIRVKVSNPEYASLTTVEPLPLESVRDSLPPGAAMISYFVSNNSVHAWVVDRTSMHYVGLPIDHEKLQSVLCWATQFIPSEQPRGARPVIDACPTIATPEDAFDALIAPLSEHLGAASMLVVVPHGVLHYVPFAALRNRHGGHYLVQDYTLVYAPSASALRFLHAKESPVQRHALVLGNPATPLPLAQLPGAEAEAASVAKMFGTTAHTGGDARESLLYHLDGKFDLLHIAAHGLYDGENPLFSRIALAPGDDQDGSLTVGEILSSLDLTGVNLVVLSACRSAAGARSGGDEVVGLTRALLYAGTPNVISTLWNISDMASAGLMNEFYRRLKGGASAAEALREAQLAILRSPAFSDPKYWAAFTLSGDPLGWSAPAVAEKKP
ncbi:MAG TPA: CHAT domain-containing protein [Thermoanaerobaculia bacterium]|nr:CHAT domain-containing protein [Thermoanaerobaculia bacterium]